MSTATRSARTEPRLGGFLRAWIWALVGFLVGEYGAGLALETMHRSGADDAVTTWAWLPWILAAVLCGLGAGVALPPVSGRPFWHWIVAAVPIPVGAAFVTLWYYSAVGVAPTGLWSAALVQVVIAGALAVGFGMMRARLSHDPI